MALSPNAPQPIATLHNPSLGVLFEMFPKALQPSKVHTHHVSMALHPHLLQNPLGVASELNIPKKSQGLGGPFWCPRKVPHAP